MRKPTFLLFNKKVRTDHLGCTSLLIIVALILSCCDDGVPQLTVAVSSSVSSGHAPMIVKFNAEASGGIEPYIFIWDFGDGMGSSLQTSSHVYQEGGSYDVTVMVRDAQQNTAVSELAVVASEKEVPIVSISVSNNTVRSSQEVQFQANVLNGEEPLDFLWQFDDEASSTVQNPVYAFENAGIYDVVLQVTDSTGDKGRASIQIVVDVDLVPSVQISATPTVGVTPLSVLFASQSYGGNLPLEYAWDLDGDGTIDSTVPNPTHIYHAAELYTVSLTITDVDGDIAQASIDINVCEDSEPQLTVSADPDNGIVPLTVVFEWTCTDGNPPYNVSCDYDDGAGSVWDSIDGGVDNEYSATHTYKISGSFRATCTLTDVDGDWVTNNVEIEAVEIDGGTI